MNLLESVFLIVGGVINFKLLFLNILLILPRNPKKPLKSLVEFKSPSQNNQAFSCRISLAVDLHGLRNGVSRTADSVAYRSKPSVTGFGPWRTYVRQCAIYL